MAVVVKNLSEETKTCIYEISSDMGLDNEREFDATSIYKREVIGHMGEYNVRDITTQIGIFESMAWHPNEENVLFVSNSLEDRHGQAQVYFQARNVENSQSFVNYKYFHRPKLAIGKRHAFLKDRNTDNSFFLKCLPI